MSEYLNNVMAAGYRRMSADQRHLTETAVAQTRQENPNEQNLPEGDSSATTELVEQADQVEEAGAVLEAGLAVAEGEYDSYSKYSAVTQKSMADKMKALGMLDDAREDVDIQMHVGTFKDPITGERVNAKNQDYVSDGAFRGAQDALVRGATTRSDWENDYAAWQNSKPREQAKYDAYQANPFGYTLEDYNADRDDSEQRRIYDNYFSDGQAMMDKAGNQYQDDFGGEEIEDRWADGVIGDMNDLYERNKLSQADTMHQGLSDERTARQKMALDATNAYNLQQTESQELANKNNAEIADSQTDIKNSLAQDKQNLAASSSMGSKPNRKTVIRDTVASERPT